MADTQQEADCESIGQRSLDPQKNLWISHNPTARKRTEDWSKKEKKLVAKALKRGRKSVTSITQQLEGTKSLRQVAQYLETLDLWSHLLGSLPPPEKRVRLTREAKETSSKTITTENVNAQRAIEAENPKMKAHDDKFRAQVENSDSEDHKLHYKHYELINLENADTLLQIVGGRRDCCISVEAAAFLGNALEEFLINAMREIFTVASQLHCQTFAMGSSSSNIIYERMVHTALTTCGFPPGKSAQLKSDELIAKHVSPRVLSKLKLTKGATNINASNSSSQDSSSESASDSSENSESEHSETGLVQDPNDFVVKDERSFRWTAYSSESSDDASEESEEIEGGHMSDPKSDEESS
ncbi:hypothetical protein COEREDRAFT_88019 [Coemansia reversa NRRL 1564]|uniref:Uncharacterized protein n=1 Tax=Coemansia reversa (strain ATCC 12441 / NRRL 1564) TaxID=763665 RepID=A0A2G5B824_COERN|nr:hypothetical protein COEREDRAFT_88019 [Coemansia reversa NRRL 1564]|eukprot:PIA15159.1 hypothetical protein COEREDRAFT_88019 [Coemansia reversa NRRL 1564]